MTLILGDLHCKLGSVMVDPSLFIFRFFWRVRGPVYWITEVIEFFVGPQDVQKKKNVKEMYTRHATRDARYSCLKASVVFMYEFFCFSFMKFEPKYVCTVWKTI